MKEGVGAEKPATRRRVHIPVAGLLLCGLLLSACSSGPVKVNRDQGLELVALINQYRQEQGLPSVPVSPTMMQVAEMHLRDLKTNNPMYTQCNLHSWSESTRWSACCYRADAVRPQCMWEKPREISGGHYRGKGFEIAAYSNVPLSAKGALLQWQHSKHHHDVILNRDIWALARWRAIGAAMDDHFAVIWFGELEDSMPESRQSTWAEN